VQDGNHATAQFFRDELRAISALQAGIEQRLSQVEAQVTQACAQQARSAVVEVAREEVEAMATKAAEAICGRLEEEARSWWEDRSTACEARVVRVEADVGGMRSELDRCSERLTALCEESRRDANDRATSVAAVQAAVHGLTTVETLTSQQQKQIQEISAQMGALRGLNEARQLPGTGGPLPGSCNVDAQHKKLVEKCAEMEGGIQSISEQVAGLLQRSLAEQTAPPLASTASLEVTTAASTPTGRMVGATSAFAQRRSSATPPRATSPLCPSPQHIDRQIYLARLAAPPPTAGLQVATSRMVTGPVAPTITASSSFEAAPQPPAFAARTQPAPTASPAVAPPAVRSPPGPTMRRLASQVGSSAATVCLPSGTTWTPPSVGGPQRPSVGSGPRGSPDSSPRGRGVLGTRGRSSCSCLGRESAARSLTPGAKLVAWAAPV